VGHVVRVDRIEDGGAWLTIRVPDELRRYLVEKGSVTVDGISLTVAAIEDDAFSVALIPHTLEVTTLGAAELAHPVNLEVDVIARYVESLLGGRVA
jgi:riboflavin synthase